MGLYQFRGVAEHLCFRNKQRPQGEEKGENKGPGGVKGRSRLMKPGTGEIPGEKPDLENSGWLSSGFNFVLCAEDTVSPPPHTASLLELIWCVLGGLQGRKPPWERRPERGIWQKEATAKKQWAEKGGLLLTSPRVPGAFEGRHWVPLWY